MGPQIQLRAIDVYSTSFGVSDRVIQDESDILEFKSGEEALANGNIRRYVGDITKKVGCAFANNKGRDLFFGISDSGLVNGLQLTRGERDELARTVSQVVLSFHPSVLDSSVQFISVGNDNWVLRVHFNKCILAATVFTSLDIPKAFFRSHCEQRELSVFDIEKRAVEFERNKRNFRCIIS